MDEDQADRLIQALDLSAHPEGGWYRETWRSPVRIGERAAGTAILFLLKAGERSAWHQVDADEIWLWHVGAALELHMADAHGSSGKRAVIGPDVLAGQAPQVLIPAAHWQAARASQGWALVSCIVTPGFEFSGFKLAEPAWAEALDRAVRVQG